MRHLLIAIFLISSIQLFAQDPFPAVQGRGGLYVDGFEKRIQEVNCLEGFQTLALIIPLHEMHKGDRYRFVVQAGKGKGTRRWSWALSHPEWLEPFIYGDYFFCWIVHPTEGFFTQTLYFDFPLTKEFLCENWDAKKYDLTITIRVLRDSYRENYNEITKTFEKIPYEENDIAGGRYLYLDLIPNSDKARKANPNVKQKELGPLPVLPGGGVAGGSSLMEQVFGKKTEEGLAERNAARDEYNNRYAVEYYGNNQVKEEGQMKDGEKSGTWRYYYENGQLRLLTNYLEGRQDGIEAQWDEDGDLVAEYNFVKGEFVGLQKQYKYGGLYLTRVYGPEKFDGQDGDETYYFDDGSVKSVLNYTKNKKQGTETTYERDGKVYMIRTFDNDKLHGPYKRYRKGVLVEEGNYTMSSKSGIWKKYNDDGTLKEEKNYDHD